MRRRRSQETWWHGDVWLARQTMAAWWHGWAQKRQAPRCFIRQRRQLYRRRIAEAALLAKPARCRDAKGGRRQEMAKTKTWRCKQATKQRAASGNETVK